MWCAQFVTDRSHFFSSQAAAAVVLRVGQIRALYIQIVMEMGRNIPPQLFERHVGLVLRSVVWC